MTFDKKLDYLMIAVGSIITGASINIFLVPYKIAPGGVSSIATILYYLSNGRLLVGTTMLILNVPLFILGMRFIGKKFVAKTLWATLLLSAVIDFTEPYTQVLTRKLSEMSNGTQDVLLYCLFGGVLMGLGLGLVFKSGATTGGTDLAARIINKFFPMLTIGEALLIIDSSIIILASIVFRSIQLGLYAIVTLFITSKLIDALLEGVNFAKAIFIISDHSHDISNKILSDLDRGVTAIEGKGMFTGNSKTVLLCIVNGRQLPLLKAIVKMVDENAFMILADVREVLGEGFKTYD